MDCRSIWIGLCRFTSLALPLFIIRAGDGLVLTTEKNFRHLFPSVVMPFSRDTQIHQVYNGRGRTILTCMSCRAVCYGVLRRNAAYCGVMRHAGTGFDVNAA